MERDEPKLKQSTLYNYFAPKGKRCNVFVVIKLILDITPKRKSVVTIDSDEEPSPKRNSKPLKRELSIAYVPDVFSYSGYDSVNLGDGGSWLDLHDSDDDSDLDSDYDSDSDSENSVSKGMTNFEHYRARVTAKYGKKRYTNEGGTVRKAMTYLRSQFSQAESEHEIMSIFSRMKEVVDHHECNASA